MNRRWAVPAVAAGVLALCVVAGPALAPHDAAAPVGPPYLGPSGAHWLGTDHLGRDVASRLLHGARPLVLTSLAGALLGTVTGAGLGLAAAVSRRRRLAAALTRPLDALAAVPAVVLMLLVLAAWPHRAGLVLAVTLAALPLTARLAAAAGAQVAGRGHVEVAVARGEKWPWVIGRELLPLVGGVLLADAGIRFVGAVYLVAAAGFLGVGTAGPDWGSLIVEALPGAPLQPWALLAPVLAVAALAVGVNLLADRAQQPRGAR
ncbi:MAG TPA: ABC transporter permease subunit [Pilimelia sp.]|nr:ABC transporter permease subunit [Pilimelia sp.]